MVVGALQLQRTQNAGDGLAPPSGKARLLTTRTRLLRPGVIRVIGVEVALDGGRRDP
jgi:hypothetical protein